MEKVMVPFELGGCKYTCLPENEAAIRTAFKKATTRSPARKREPRKFPCCYPGMSVQEYAERFWHMNGLVYAGRSWHVNGLVYAGGPKFTGYARYPEED